MADFELGPANIDLEAGKIKISASYEHEFGDASIAIAVKGADIIRAIVASTENEIDDVLAAPFIAMLEAAE